MITYEQDVLAWIGAHAEHWRPRDNYPGIDYWTLARTRARNDREFLAVVEYVKEHGAPGRFTLDGKQRKNAVPYLKLTIDDQPRLLWSLPVPTFMLRGLFMAADAGQIRWVDQDERAELLRRAEERSRELLRGVRTRTRPAGLRGFEPLTF